MSWPQWTGGVAQPGAVATQPGVAAAPPLPGVANTATNIVNPAGGVINSAPAVLPPGLQYTPEQWAQMQQQNWQQWAQWQQQYQQWHQQYGAEFQKSMNALSASSATTAYAPPLPTEIKPPLPPEEPPPPINQPSILGNSGQQFNMFTMPPPIHTARYNTTPMSVPPPKFNSPSNTQNPPQLANPQNQPPVNVQNQPGGAGGGGQMKPNQNWQNYSNNQNYSNSQYLQPPPMHNTQNADVQQQNKRPMSQQNDYYNSKRNRYEQNADWHGQQQQQQQKHNFGGFPHKPNIEELSEAEKKFDKEFAAWEAQFNKWKEQNAGHPDKEQYKEYEKKWEEWRAKLLERREQMRRKRLSLCSNSPGRTPDNPPYKSPQLGGNAPQKPPPTNFPKAPSNELKPHEKIDFDKEPQRVIQQPEEKQTSFLSSSTLASGGIPGLDLVKEDANTEEKEPTNLDKTPLKKNFDFDALSKNISSILGDPKLLTMLSQVSQNHNLNTAANTDSTPIVKPDEKDFSFVHSTNSHQSEHSNFDDPYCPDQREGINISNFDDQTRSSFTGRVDQDYDKQAGDNSNISNMSNNAIQGKFTSNDNYGRNYPEHDEFNVANRPNKFTRGPPDNFNRFDNFGRRPNPNDFARGENFNNFNRNDAYRNDSFGRHDNFVRNDNFGGTDNFGRAPNFNRGNNFNRGQGFNRNDFNNREEFNRSGGFNRGDFGRTGNFNRQPINDDFNKGDPFINRPNFGSGNNSDFNRGPNNFNRGAPNSVNRGPNFREDSFNKSDNFSGRGNFNSDNFVRNEPPYVRDNFGRAPDDFNEGAVGEHSEGVLSANISEINDAYQEDLSFNNEAEFNTDTNASFGYESIPSNNFGDEQNSRFSSECPENIPPNNSDAYLEPKNPEEDMLKPSVVIEYDHKSKRQPEFEVSIEPVQMFDYRHKPLNRIPLPQRPKWLNEIVKNYYEFDPLSGRPFEQLRRYSSVERYRGDKRKGYDDRPYEKRYDERRRHERNENFGKPYDYEPSKKYDRCDDYDTKKSNYGRNPEISHPKRDNFEKQRVDYEGTFEQQSEVGAGDDEPFQNEEEMNENDTIRGDDKFVQTSRKITLIEDLLNPPERFKRPPRIVIILRGPPGSGKTYLAKLIKDKEVENGGSAPRILSLDDYFLIEQEKEVVEDGKHIKIKDMVYEYEESMEATYRASLLKSFKKTVTDGLFSFIIVDNVNEKVKYFGEMWSFAKQNGFQVYVCQMELDVQTCTKRNIHGRTEEDIQKCVSGWEQTPAHHPTLDATSLIQAASIPDVEMEEIDSPTSLENDVKEEDQAYRSKWDNFDCSVDNLAKLDGISKPLRPSRTMEDYLQLEEWTAPAPSKPGQKRVRWADLEERKEQEKMRAIGFVVGHTDWNRMMDPTMGGSALTQTKYIERVRRY